MLSRRLLLTLAVTLFAGACCAGRPDTSTPPPVASSEPRADCLVRRAAFDIGSATTKLQVAEVDVCEGRVVRILLRAEEAVLYREEVSEARPPAAFSQPLMDRGVEVVRALKERANAHAPGAFVGVATAAFRRAQNAQALVERMHAEAGVTVRIIDQREEAALGFAAATRAAGVDPRVAVVWDVGGRSMQIAAKRAVDGDMLLYEGHIASGQMKDQLVHVIQGKPRDTATPNPISADDAQAARDWAEEQARETLPAELRERLAVGQAPCVGIGALKYFSDSSPAEARELDRAKLETGLRDRLGKSDAELGGGPYAATVVSDRILISAYMRVLGLERIRLADVDLSDGLLLDERYWNGRRAR